MVLYIPVSDAITFKSFWIQFISIISLLTVIYLLVSYMLYALTT